MRVVCHGAVLGTATCFTALFLDAAQSMRVPEAIPTKIFHDRALAVNQSDSVQAECLHDLIKVDTNVHKSTYRVGVQAHSGKDAAKVRFEKLFGEYLTQTAGARFDPPISFEMKALNYQEIFEEVESESVDFIYSDGGVYSCIGNEFGAEPIATTVMRLSARGHEYDLSQYGGVIFAKSDRFDIAKMEDIADKIVGAGSFDMLMGGQLQFHAMEQAGMSYIMDPKQVVLTMDQSEVVQGVLDGEFDVGFVRTAQIESHRDANGDLIDGDVFKILEPQVHALEDGKLFPFLHSTDIYAEYPFAALRHVNGDVSREVQEALLALSDHRWSHEQYLLTRTWDPQRCDTSMEIGELASDVYGTSLIHGFRTARSYFEISKMQQEAGFLVHGDEEWKCDRSENLFDRIQCPEGYYKLPFEEYEKTCENAGLSCKPGYQCYCKPCIKAHQVDVFPCWHPDDWVHEDRHLGCDKMSVCVSLMQTEEKTIRILDNLQRDEIEVTATIHQGPESYEIPVHYVSPYYYKILFSSNIVGSAVLEVFFNGDQIPDSPFRLQVDELDCEIDHPGERKTSNSNGQCVCRSSTMDLFGKCIESTVVAISVSAVAVLLIGIVGSIYVRWRTHKNDEIWMVNIDELQFSDPVEVIGQGSFGVVLLADYRGTKVALKRALKSGGKGGSTRKRSSWTGSRGASRGSSRGGSRNKSDQHAGDSLDPYASSGLGSSDTSDSEENVDLEMGDEGSEPRGATGGQSGTRSGSNPFSLGFLARDFGHGKSGWRQWLPWSSRGNDYHAQRFKEVIFGASSRGSNASMTKSWHARFCPWFNTQVKQEEEFMSEMRVLARLRHPCITTVMGAVITRSHDPMLVMEYMEYGSLHDLLNNETVLLSGEIILQILRDLAQGLRFLHTSKPAILHGDLKGRNILIDSRFRAKLCDFGLSTKTGSRITGTPFWLAPEYLRGQTNYTSECDIYSVGIVIYEIYARKDPYKGEDFRETLRKICDRRTNKRPTIPEDCPSKMQELMKKCWSPDPNFRPAARDLDTCLLDMSAVDCEPQEPEVHAQCSRKERPTGDMLYQLFPKHVAEQLKAGLKVEPEQHECVTVLFMDVVHFDEISQKLPPAKISDMLNRLYLAFDKVAKANNVFQVETVGDCFMGVTNLEKDQGDTHAKQVAKCAMDMIEEAGKTLVDSSNTGLGCINVKIGFHTGPVVSNVIGSLNPRYCLFGDTVNTASRMASNARANRVLCSETGFKILSEQAPEISVKKRGRIFVKGKGEMNVFWVGDDEIQEKINPNTAAMSPLAADEGKCVGFTDNEDEVLASAESPTGSPSPVSKMKKSSRKIPEPAMKKSNKPASKPSKHPEPATKKPNKPASKPPKHSRKHS